MQDDKKQPKTEETSADAAKVATENTTPATTGTDKKEEDNSDWVAVGSGLGIDE